LAHLEAVAGLYVLLCKVLIIYHLEQHAHPTRWPPAASIADHLLGTGGTGATHLLVDVFELLVEV
jgi:hypothetical protein